jgi:hypothetical protein
MHKIFLLILLVPALSHAQLKGFSVGPYLEAAQTAGAFSETNKNGFGAGFHGDIRLGKLGFTGSAGFMHFGGRTLDKTGNSFKTPGVNAVPLRVGVKYRLAPFLFAKLESGVAKFTSGNEYAFIFSPGLAARIMGFEIHGKYEIWKRHETYSFWGLKASYNF